MADDSKTPHQGGTLDDTTRPSGGYGKPSENDPVMPSPQPVKISDITPRRKK